MSSYTKNEIALINFQSDINKLFYYIGEEDDQVPFYALAKFNRYCTTFINSLEIDPVSYTHLTLPTSNSV